MEKRRNSNFELCRIITMVIIILNHVVSLGETIDNITFDKNTVISLFMLLGGKFGTNVFVILGIYFLVNSEFKFERIIKLWLQTLFYMLILNIFDVMVFDVDISMNVWIKSFMPVLGRSYWFASSYIILLLLIPGLNYLYRKIQMKLLYVLLGLFVFSVFPTITFNGNLFGNSTFIKIFFKLLLFGPIWFSFLYLCIKFLKDNYTKHWLFNRSAGFYFVSWIVSYLFMCGGLC